MNGVGLQKTSFLCSMDISQNSSSRGKDLGAGKKTAQLVKYLINKHEDLILIPRIHLKKPDSSIVHL